MNDQELLELAAKAAGINQSNWNPLINDIDAFHLLADLGIDIEWLSHGRVAAYRHCESDSHYFMAIESSQENRLSNARRAIVRAAADVGRGDI